MTAPFKVNSRMCVSLLTAPLLQTAKDLQVTTKDYTVIGIDKKLDDYFSKAIEESMDRISKKLGEMTAILEQQTVMLNRIKDNAGNIFGAVPAKSNKGEDKKPGKEGKEVVVKLKL